MLLKNNNTNIPRPQEAFTKNPRAHALQKKSGEGGSPVKKINGKK